MRKDRRKRHTRYIQKNEKNCDNLIVPSKEDIERHPELSREKIEEKKHFRQKIHRYMSKEIIDRFNKQSYTYLILSMAIVLGIIYITFGIICILAIFGYRENITWHVYQATQILGWNQLKITGFIFVIIGTIMIWSIPFYITDKTQQADSYLVIATGLSMLFGFVYILILIADVLNAIIIAVIAKVSISIETYFYLPIILAIISIPIFRILVIRHMIVLPDVGKDIPLNRWSRFYRDKSEWKGRHGWKNHHTHRWAHFKKKWYKMKKNDRNDNE